MGANAKNGVWVEPEKAKFGCFVHVGGDEGGIFSLCGMVVRGGGGMEEQLRGLAAF